MKEFMQHNTDKSSMKIIDSYPIAIDPASHILSIRVDNTWRHLLRIAPTSVNRVLPTSNQRCHFFGDGQSFDDSQLLLSYDAAGAVSGIWKLFRGHWDDCFPPEEARGQPVLCASVRFLFASTQDRSRFMEGLASLLETTARRASPSSTAVKQIAAAMGRSPSPPRELHVALVTAVHE